MLRSHAMYVLFVMMPPSLSSTLFPYTTLFRSKGRLQPGRMLLIDTEEKRIVADEELKRRIATERPYRQWLKENLVADRKSTRLNSSHLVISYAVFCLKKKIRTLYKYTFNILHF